MSSLPPLPTLQGVIEKNKIYRGKWKTKILQGIN
jgi:hypothetical protein